MILDPTRLSFGALAAENDIQRGLKDYFIESPSYQRLRDGERIVALGNRGSGKTAIFKMIADHLRGHRTKKARVIELAPEDFSYELLSRTMTPEDRGAWAKQGAYAAAWKYVIYVLAMKDLASSGVSLKTGPAKRIYHYLRDNHDTFPVNPIGALISYLKRLESIKVGPFEAGIKARELQKLYRLEEIGTLLDDLNTLAGRNGVTVLVDELDRGWDASEDAKAFVAGLFQAATTIQARTPNVRVLVSLRRELYESIPALYDDAQKVRDWIEVIEWNEPELLKLVARRIAHSFRELGRRDDNDLWNLAFGETLDYRQTKSFNYLVDRTLYRPREIIQLCQAAVDAVIAEAAGLPATYRIIGEAEHQYSEARCKDIAAEYRFQYPGLGSVFESFRGKSYSFEREELEVQCLGILMGDYRVDPAAKDWCSTMEPDDLIEVLWRIGFLQAQAVGGMKARRRSGSEYLGSHQVSSLNLRNAPRFHVHPMFRAFLGLKEPKRTRED
ncbi:MAG: hypothetical protein AB7O37_00020 [Vicinamibacteria bacterium]